MHRQRRDGPTFVLPPVRYGNIVLMPQPARGWGERPRQDVPREGSGAARTSTSPAYAWLRNGFTADAVVHVGTHGTLEWLDGKDIGLSTDDAPDALIADIPDLYIYNVDVVGEGLVARRRGMATLVDHMVPPFKKGGLLPDLSELSENITDFDKRQADNPELARAYGERIRTRLICAGHREGSRPETRRPQQPRPTTMHARGRRAPAAAQRTEHPLRPAHFGRVPDKPAATTAPSTRS